MIKPVLGQTAKEHAKVLDIECTELFVLYYTHTHFTRMSETIVR